MTKQQIGDFIKKERIAQNLTQRELADKIEYRRQVLIEIENSQCDYGIGIVIKIIEALGYQLVPTIKSTELPAAKLASYLNFKSIEPAKEENDPNLQDKKKDRIFAQSNRKHKQKTT